LNNIYELTNIKSLNLSGKFINMDLIKSLKRIENLTLINFSVSVENIDFQKLHSLCLLNVTIMEGDLKNLLNAAAPYVVNLEINSLEILYFQDFQFFTVAFKRLKSFRIIITKGNSSLGYWIDKISSSVNTLKQLIIDSSQGSIDFFKASNLQQFDQLEEFGYFGSSLQSFDVKLVTILLF
jgi:hypothetical protein